MFRNAAAGGILAIVVFSGGACVPGAIAPRRGAGVDGAGSGSGEDIIAVRDGAAGGGLTAGSDPAPAGKGGVSGKAVDAALPIDAGPPERPKLPPPDAAGGSARDATPDAPHEDATAPDVRPDGPSARQPRIGELVIDELLVNPTGDDLGREWIEVENLGGDWLDLSELHLANASVDVAVAGGRIAPGGLRVFGQSADPTKNGGAPIDVAYGTKLILNNANGQVSICIGVCASGVVLDTVSWGALGDDTTGHALVVDPVTKAICAASTPFGTGASFGTPGAPNPSCAETADAASPSDIADVSVAD